MLNRLLAFVGPEGASWFATGTGTTLLFAVASHALVPPAVWPALLLFAMSVLVLTVAAIWLARRPESPYEPAEPPVPQWPVPPTPLESATTERLPTGAGRG